PQGVFTVLAVAMGAAYGLSRTRHYRWGIWISLFFLAAFSIFPVFFVPERNASQLAQNAMWVILPLILASMVLTIRSTVVLAVMALVLILLLPVIDPAIRVADIIPVFGFILTWVAAHLTFLSHIRLLEKDRQTELRQKAEELTEVNKALNIQIAERKLAEDKIEASLHEKEVLLKEIHHRVKNNLQVISSLLNLQSSSVADKENLSVFQDSQNRIRSMALIHQKLYQSSDLARVDFDDYIRELTAHLAQSYRFATPAEIYFDLEPILLEIDTAVSCGLIINELVSNIFKHAFPPDKNGKIFIKFRQTSHRNLILMVGDNGVGMPEEIDCHNTMTLGLQLVNMLVDQLSGDFHVERTPGTTFIITFPVPEYKL
ncbi:MAG: hypothetical protein H6667_16440, partial [Ardenticatenaceae bacterium]|nr:hypothetical protein [Ardenticatenaceae bacterium]